MPKDVAIHMFNTSEPAFKNLYKKNPRSPDGLPTGAVGAYDESTPEQVVAAAQKVAAGDRVRVMRLVGHGNAGTFYFPGLEDYYSSSLAYVKLRGIFAAGGRLEIHGCGVASETNILPPGLNPRDATIYNTLPGQFTGRSDGAGLVYLRRIAAIFNVPTTAAVNGQMVSTTEWKFEGRTVTVEPNGKFLLQDDNTRTWDVLAQEKAAKDYYNRIEQSYIFKHQYEAAIRQLRDLIRVFPLTQTAAWAQDNLTVAAMKRIDESAFRPQ